jgi:cysteine synthase A
MNAPDAKTGQRIAGSVLELVGNTPILKLNRLPGAGAAEVLAKIESLNPGGSVKDRIALNMIERGEEMGLVKPGTVVIEPTSGNTGIGLAMVCAAKGYRCVIVMPDSMSLERIVMLKRFGAEVVLTPGKDDIAGAVRRAEELTQKTKNAFSPRQFENEHNPDVHRRTTAAEILEALATSDSPLDAFVATVGTGGTISGVGEVLKERIPGLRVIAVEPERSPVLSGGKPGLHKIQGIGAGFVPKTLNRAVIDEVRTVADDAAFEAMKGLAAQEGILAGMSAGAAAKIAIDVARQLGPGKRVLTVLPDTGERYLTVQHYFEF